VREIPGPTVDARGVLNRPKRFRGCEHTIVSTPCYVGDHASDDNVERLMRCPEAARLKWTTSERVRPQIVALSVTEKAPEQSGQLTRVAKLREQRSSPRMGNPVLEWKAAGGHCPALKVRGRKQTLACRPAARTIVTKIQCGTAQIKVLDP